MNNRIKLIFAFMIGTGVGSAITWKLVKEKYSAIAQEEIDSVKEVYSKKHREIEEDEGINIVTESKDADEEEDADGWINEYDHQYAEYRKIASKYGHNDEKVSSYIKDDGPEVIPPDEFGEYLNYDTESLTFYEGDGVLTDDRDNVVEDVEIMVGPNALDSFGEWEDDRVCVLNNATECYYEILRDNGKYSDLIKEDTDGAANENEYA